MVFVEESEAHLPLRAQRLIARLLVRAANTDETFVIITTHSDYLLSTLSSLVEDHVMLSGKEKEKLEELGYDMLDIPERFLLTCLNWEKRSLS